MIMNILYVHLLMIFAIAMIRDENDGDEYETMMNIFRF